MKIKFVVKTETGFLTGEALKTHLQEVGFQMPKYISYKPVALPERPTCPTTGTLENVIEWKKYTTALNLAILKNKALKADFNFKMASLTALLESTFVMAVYVQQGTLPDGRKNMVWAIVPTTFKWSTAAVQVNGKNIDFICNNSIGY
jgi:hypothetical protein